MIEDLNGFETEEKVSSFRVLLVRGPDRKTLTEWRLMFYLINYLISKNSNFNYKTFPQNRLIFYPPIILNTKHLQNLIFSRSIVFVIYL